MSNSFRCRMFAYGLTLTALSAAPGMAATPTLSFSSDDRVLVLAPHPDDEVIACGGVIQQALAAHLPVQVVFLTYGDNNQWSFAVYRKHLVLEPAAVRTMGLVRHNEALAADHLLGLAPNQLFFLGYPDFGTLHIWEQHWGNQPPFESMLTKVTQVPYSNAFHVGAAYKGDDILGDLKSILSAFRPTKVFLSHPADHNPDHRALFLFTRVALWDLQPQFESELIPYLVHYKKWPVPRAYDPVAALTPPFTLDSGPGWSILPLASNEVATKEAALRQHQTQYAYASNYLNSFVRQNELFGDLPAIRIQDAGPEGRTELDEQEPGADLAEELTDLEKASFLGIETRHVWREGDTLVMELNFTKEWLPGVEAQIEFFGYRPDQPFSSMPKIRVQVGKFEHRVLDQQRLLTQSGIQIIRAPRQIQIRIPLGALGGPDRILTSGRTYLVDIPLDWLSWRILELAPLSGSPAVPSPP